MPLLAEVRTRLEVEKLRLSMDEAVRSRARLADTPVVELNPDEAIAQAYVGTGSPEVPQWKAIASTKTKKGSRIRNVLTDAQGRIWASAQDGGLVRVTVGAEGGLQVATAATCQGSTEDLVIRDGWAFGADWSYGLAVFNLRGATAAAVVTHPRLVDSQAGKVALAGYLAALVSDRGVQLYDVSNPPRPKPLSHVGVGYSGEGKSAAKDAEIVGTTLFVATSCTGLVTVDVSNPQQPRILAALGCQEAGAEEPFSAETVEVREGVAFLASSGRTWLVDVRDPAAPRSICLLGARGTNIDWRAWLPDGPGADGSQRYLIVDEDQPLLWTVDVWPDRAASVVGAVQLVDQKGESATLYYAESALRISAERILVGRGYNELTLLERCEVPAVDAGEAKRLRQAAEPGIAWLRQRLADYAAKHPEGQAGLVAVSVSGGDLTLRIGTAQTVAGGVFRCDKGDPNANQKISLATLLPGEAAREEEEDEEEPEEDDDEHPDAERRYEVLQRLTGTAENDLEAICARALVAAPELREVMSGRLYLMRSGTIIDILERPDRPWAPFRSACPERVARPLSERIKDYHNWDSIAAKAQKDPSLRAEILALVAQEDGNALRVAWRFCEVDEDGYVAALLQATRGDDVSIDFLQSLGDYAQRPEVVSVLQQAWHALPEDVLEDGERLVLLARCLGRRDDERVLGLARGLLTLPELRYDVLDLSGKAMDLLDQRMPELLPTLREAQARLSPNDNRMSLVCRHLFRAGHRELPAALKEQARREKRDEEYADVKLGIKLLDEVEHADPTCAAERLYTGWMLAERVRQLCETNDRTSSVWPPELPPEPFPASWKRVLLAAMDHILKGGLLESFVELLASHAVPDAAYVPDRALLLGMLEYFQNRKEWATYGRLAEVVLASPAFDEKTKERMEQRKERVELAQGWELLKAGELAAARRIADTLLASEPDGQELFFDARLRWLESGSPQAAVDAATRYLDDLTTYDPPGRGRLLNLTGAALDALGKTAEAIRYFEKAFQAHPEDPLYLANLAEGHDKLGQRETALKYAREALQRKADSEICRRIVAAGEASGETTTGRLN